MDLYLASFWTLTIEERHAAIRDHVDQKIITTPAAAAPAQQGATETRTRDESERERAHAQEKEPRSNGNSSHGHAVVQGITIAFQAIQVQQQQAVAT